MIQRGLVVHATKTVWSLWEGHKFNKTEYYTGSHRHSLIKFLYTSVSNIRQVEQIALWRRLHHDSTINVTSEVTDPLNMSQSCRLAKNHLHTWLHASWQNTKTAGWLTGLTINQTNQQQEKLQKLLVNSPVMGETIYKIVKFLLVIIFKMPKKMK